MCCHCSMYFVISCMLWRTSTSHVQTLTLKVLITTTADDILIFLYFSENIRHSISCELSAWQAIHMKCKSYFLWKMIIKQFRMSSTTILLITIRVKTQTRLYISIQSFQGIYCWVRHATKLYLHLAIPCSQRHILWVLIIHTASKMMVGHIAFALYLWWAFWYAS